MPRVNKQSVRGAASSHIRSILALAVFCLFYVMRNTSKLSTGLIFYYGGGGKIVTVEPHGFQDPTRFQKAVHLVHTRFMQGQPHLRALGNSRIELFRTFCLPTMANQTNNDFLWIILIDPNLDDILLDEMKQLVAPYPHFFLVKKVAQEIDLANLDFSIVTSGDTNLLMQAARASRTKILLQTRLGADDGLAYELIDQLQKTTVEILHPPHRKRPEGWMITCVKKHFEWHYDLHTNKSTDRSGWLRQSITPSYCITPGLTLALAPGGRTWNETEQLPIYPHDRISKRFRRCGGDDGNRRTECYRTLNEIREPGAVRSRTPASSFMKGVGTTEKRVTPEHDWDVLQHMFGLTRETLTETRTYLIGNMAAIAKENLASQCTGMNPCHQKDLARLATLAGVNITDLGEEAVIRPDDNNPRKFEKAVHMVYTRFMQGQPDLLALGRSRLELFRTVCLPSMTNQTINDFLWFILVDPHLHPAIMTELKRLVQPYPHFFIVRQISFDIQLESLNLSLLASGDKSLVVHAARESRSKVLLETRLDADDGLANTLLENMKRSAVETFHGWRGSTNEQHWVVQCVLRHLEWHYSHSNETKYENGWLDMQFTPKYCVTPGLTLAQPPGQNRTNFKAIGPHDKIVKRYSSCGGKQRSSCFRILNEHNESQPAAIRSRTPASSFMQGVGMEKQEQDTPLAYWEMLETMFSIPRTTLGKSRQYMVRNVQAIAKENLAAQCRGMNSCNEAAKERLAKLAGTGK